MTRGAALLAALALPAAAQDKAPAFDAAPVHACLEAGRPDCVGAAAEACMAASPGGSTTAGMADCTLRETAAWDRLLNVEYRALRAALAAEDAAAAAGDGGIVRADALRDAQRAWIAFRDAECLLRYARDQGGTIRALTGAACRLEQTARRTLELAAMAREAQAR